MAVTPGAGYLSATVPIPAPNEAGNAAALARVGVEPCALDDIVVADSCADSSVDNTWATGAMKAAHTPMGARSKGGREDSSCSGSATERLLGLTTALPSGLRQMVVIARSR